MISAITLGMHVTLIITEVMKLLNKLLLICMLQLKHAKVNKRTYTVFYCHFSKPTPSGFGAQWKKKYYLCDAMQFMFQFIKSRTKQKPSLHYMKVLMLRILPLVVLARKGMQTLK
jgi:hypothetical protein